ncbi:hypothetical protein BDN72DRAFT_502305 [Pluteus cervinus]|uniref:Uncharacterized protein n=1 Tax=Pluteus cervinus TaxID=181527 RepID=A0ACD3AYV1_9AGAR|nr:hypothetical protein BDN72DRAFT_502305 [Pluteus cervinus]
MPPGAFCTRPLLLWPRMGPVYPCLVFILPQARTYMNSSSATSSPGKSSCIPPTATPPCLSKGAKFRRCHPFALSRVDYTLLTRTKHLYKLVRR